MENGKWKMENGKWKVENGRALFLVREWRNNLLTVYNRIYWNADNANLFSTHAGEFSEFF